MSANKSVEYCDDCHACFEASCMQSVVGMLKSHDCPGAEEDRVHDAAQALRACPVTDASYHPHGEEHFHPDVGEYWKPPCVNVTGDMSDPAVVRVISKVCDDHALKVHVHHGVEAHGDDWARLVPKKPEGDSL